jgi:uncharacterized membrane protein YgdD (TMEM256/DUF423 family)
MILADRVLVLCAAACGLAGVVFSAAATHGPGGGTMATGATFLLFHAPVILAIGLLGASHAFRTSAAVLLAGVALFSADLIIRSYGFERLFPMAAPAGGVLMILGWFTIGLSGLFSTSAVSPRS